MNRQILFRGKRIDNGEWIYGWYSEACFGSWPLLPAIVPMDDARSGYRRDIEIDLTTLGQYTGLTDKNGKRIFEGDILKVASERRNYMMAVKFGVCGGVKNVDCQVGYMGFYFSAVDEHTKECMKYAMRNDPIYYLNSTLCEVIGNIHDNKEFDAQNGEEKEDS